MVVSLIDVETFGFTTTDKAPENLPAAPIPFTEFDLGAFPILGIDAAAQSAGSVAGDA
jgi:hypothetical protein